jgi:hypothetical protein
MGGCRTDARGKTCGTTNHRRGTFSVLTLTDPATFLMCAQAPESGRDCAAITRLFMAIISIAPPRPSSADPPPLGRSSRAVFDSIAPIFFDRHQRASMTLLSKRPTHSFPRGLWSGSADRPFVGQQHDVCPPGRNSSGGRRHYRHLESMPFQPAASESAEAIPRM